MKQTRNLADDNLFGGLWVNRVLCLLQVLHWDQTLHIPREANLTQPAVELILQLCCGATERLGKNGAGEIKSQPFFNGIQFEGLRKQKAIYVPKIRHAMDTSHFDPVEERDDSESDSEILRHFDHPQNGKHPEHAFFEFTFRRFFDDGGHPYPTVKNVKVVEKEETESNSESNSPVYV